MKQWATDFLVWLAGCTCITVAAWSVDWRLGLTCAGATLLWFSRPRLWGN